MGKLSLTGKRILAGVVLMQVLFFLANYYVFHFFRPHDKALLIASGVITVAYALYLGANVEEFREHRTKKRSSAK